MYLFNFPYKITKVKNEKKKKKNNQPHGKFWLVEHKNCHREFLFHLSNMHPTRLHEENNKTRKYIGHYKNIKL